MIMKFKGQTLVFEQVLLFTVGVIILMASFALFMMYQNHYTQETSQDQITQVKEYVLSNIIELCENDEFNSSITLSIPKTIGGVMYKLSLSNVGLNITQEPIYHISDFSTLYGLNETFTVGGMVISDAGKVILYKNGKNIILNRDIIQIFVDERPHPTA